MSSVDSDAPAAAPSFTEALRFWALLGCINFGGPAGQIALMHRELVDRRRWIPDAQFLRALNFCTLLPGPEAQQLATYIGWRLHGVAGGVAAGSLFVIPSVFVLLALSYVVAAYDEVPSVAALLWGVQAVVIALVVEAVVRLGRRALRHPVLMAVALTAFLALFILAVPFPLIVVAALVLGPVLRRAWPAAFVGGAHGASSEALPADPRHFSLTRALATIGTFLVLWAVPVGALFLWRGANDVLTQLALFFTQAAFVTFGGAYAVLSYVSDVAVHRYGWLDARQMIQGLGLAESTPGPLIMVLQYVGFMAGWNQASDLPPVVNAILGGLITTYVTFLPSFLFIFLGGPFVESLAGNRALQASLAAVTAAIVGVILNLAVFFARGVLLPTPGSPDIAAGILAILAYVALQRFHVPIYYVVPAGAVLGLVWRMLGSG